MKARVFIVANVFLATVALQGCKHPLAIEGEGDIVDANNSGHGCTLEQFQAQDTACTENEVGGDYFVNYKAEPRPGWRFVRWDGPCSPRSDFQYCHLNVSKSGVAWWDETYPDIEVPASTAVFAPISGETGFLLGPAVAGVAWETPTQQGVTGLDGSFHYEEGETVRFMIGDTVLGEVTGQAQVTPFDLAGTPLITGIQISLEQGYPGFPLPSWYHAPSYEWQDPAWDTFLAVDYFYRPDPFHTVVNITVLLQSLDEDADPENGIVITPGVTELFRGVSLDLRREWGEFLSYRELEGSGEFPTLRYQLQKANKKRHFSVPHGVVKPAIALQRLYETLGIDPRTYATCPRRLFSNNGDSNCKYDANGNLTWLQSQSGNFIASYEYDGNGYLTRAEEDWGSRQEVSNWQYDTMGNLVRYVRDHSEGTPDSIDTWQYDEDGKMLRHESDYNADGTMDQFETMQYDGKGRPTRHESRYADRQSWHIKSWQYDANGIRRRYKDAFLFEHSDGSRYKTKIWKYDARGRLRRYYTEEAFDEENWVQIETWQYGSQGKVTRKGYFGEGQAPVYIAHYQFDTNGKLVRYVREYPSASGSLGDRESWQYDKNGNMLRYEKKHPVKDELLDVETWQYDARGKPLRVETHQAGVLVKARTWQYNANGMLTRYEEGLPAGGAPDLVRTWQYNSSGKLTRIEWSVDGQIFFKRWKYDADGNLVRFWRNHGIFEDMEPPGEIESWQYHTTGWGHIFSSPDPW